MNTNNTYKEEVFDLINRFSSYNSKLILDVQKSFHIIGYQGELPNIGITLNNKLVEFMHEFKNANIAMFPYEDSENAKFSLGTLITICMYNKAKEAVDLIVKYKDDFTEMANKHLEPFYKYVRSSPTKQFFLRIKHFIIDPPGPLFSFYKDELQILNGYFASYKEIDDNMWNSGLKDYIIPCVMDYIRKNNIDKNEVKKLLNEYIIPDLKNLKFDDVIPELEAEISQLFNLDDFTRKNSWDLSEGYNLETAVGYTPSTPNPSEKSDNEVR